MIEEQRIAREYSENTIGGINLRTGNHPAGSWHVDCPTCLQVLVLSDSCIVKEQSLPFPPDSHYDIDERKLSISFVPDGDNWRVRCGRGGSLTDEAGVEAESFLLCDRQLLRVTTYHTDYRLYVEAYNARSRLFHNYMVVTDTPIRIGRANDNDIICDIPSVSRHHMELMLSENKWQLVDCQSAHGVYVNGQRVEQTYLKAGDVVRITGIRFTVGCGFLSISDGNGQVIVNSSNIGRVDDTSQVLTAIMPGTKKESAELFNRFPRNRIAFETKEIEIDLPPMSMNGEQMPLLMRMGSSMVMGSRAAMTGNVAMLAGSVFLPLLAQQYTKEEKEEYERNRVTRYRGYLDSKWKEILEEKAYEERVLTENYPALSTVLEYAFDKRKLWERRKTNDDFLRLRIGWGNVPMFAEINYPKRSFELEVDPLADEMYAMVERRVLLEHSPIMLDLLEDRVAGILGDHKQVRAFARDMIMRLSLLYSYDEVKLVILADSDDLAEMEFVRYLPHFWDDQRSIRFVASEPAEAYQVGEHITKTIGDDLEKPRDMKDMLKARPYYIVFALSKRLFDDLEILKVAMQSDKNCGVTVFACFDDLPKECFVLMELNTTEENKLVYLQDIDKEDEKFNLDACNLETAERSMRALANIELKLLSQAYALPKSYTFLEMFDVGRIEQLNIYKRWQENDPTKSLEVPIGISTNGELFKLDLHQKYHGPHGLVAGTTGSGKSEFLLTYIVSLSMSFHPDEVSFLLIDYKGGGLAGAFDDPDNGIHLPHLVGTITNLDGSAIARSLVCIQSEMIRRQVVFQQAKKKSGEGTMDIYTYQRLYRRGVVDEPMSHLFIISDEFAELKQQQPEFLNALVSIARVGRSLGVHLILATQKPAGIVTDQIVSNTKFRVCLKVQDRADSIDMLRRPDASELRETGRFYLQVGTNEIFALGQAAWCGAEYEPSDTKLIKKDNSINVVDNIGSSVLNVAPVVERSVSGKSQLVAIVQELTALAKAKGISPRQLWMPPLDDKIDIDSLDQPESRSPGSVVFSCGVLDAPASLAQYPLTIDLMTSGNLLVVGEPGNGKTTFIQSMLYVITKHYTPEQFNFYALDYSSRLLKLFGGLPHCGAVLTEEEENQLDSFFELINDIVRQRKELFGKLEVDSYETACQVKQIPLILVIIDNYIGMANSKRGQVHQQMMQAYIQNSITYGVRFVISINHLNEVSSRVRQQLLTSVTFHMRDKYEYSEALNSRVSYLPPEKKGRGLFVHEGNPLEMQIAVFSPDLPDRERISALKASIQDIAQQLDGSVTARRIKTISTTQTYEDFCQDFSPGRIPLGYALNNGKPTALPMKQFSMLTLYFGDRDSVAPVISNILYAFERENAKRVLMRTLENSRFARIKHMQGVNVFDATGEYIDRIVVTLIYSIGERRALIEQYCTEKGLDPELMSSLTTAADALCSRFTPIVLIFERLADLVLATQTVNGLVKNYTSLYQLARYYQIYMIGCIYPDEGSLLNGAPIYENFNKEQLVMLFGGNLNRQRIVSIPYNSAKQDKESAYNKCLVHYRGELYPLMMPCGVLEKEMIPEDDRPIFDRG